MKLLKILRIISFTCSSTACLALFFHCRLLRFFLFQFHRIFSLLFLSFIHPFAFEYRVRFVGNGFKLAMVNCCMRFYHPIPNPKARKKKPLVESYLYKNAHTLATHSSSSLSAHKNKKLILIRKVARSNRQFKSFAIC